MKLAAISIAAAMSVLAPQALAQARTAQRISPPYTPAGYVMEQTQDCRIVSSGGAPDARLQCTPGLGWRLVSDDGSVVYPESGYMTDDTDWAFSGVNTIIFRSRGALTRVELPSRISSSLGRGNLKQLGDVEGLPFEAVVWNSGEPARPLQADGMLGPEIAGTDMEEAEDWVGDICGSAAVLMLIGAERMPNTVWTEMRRETPSGVSVCDRSMGSRMAGRGTDGKWQALDPSTFKAKSSSGFATAEEALAWK